MATYATQQDFANYVEGWVTQDANALERLLLRAEKDIDRVLVPMLTRTNSIQGIQLSPGITGGDFTLSLEWNGVTYTTDLIPSTATGDAVLVAVQNMIDEYGNFLPADAWSIPEQKYYSQPWAYGPLPNIPVVLEAVNFLGSQPLPVMTGNPADLTGGVPAVTVTELVRGGLKVNPYLLNGKDAQVLRDATCAQAEYRMEMGEQFFRRAQWQSVSGPEFRTQGKLPLIGPKTLSELANSDLVQRGARAVPGPVTERQIVYSPVGTTPIPDDWRAV